MMAESGGNPTIVSSKGAVGLFQLMPGTAAQLGVTDPTDPTQNIIAGLKYDQQMYNQFGDWNSALIAYNEGPGAFASGTVVPSAQSYASKILASSGVTDSGAPGGLDSSEDAPDDSTGGSDSGGFPGGAIAVIAAVAFLGLLAGR